MLSWSVREPLVNQILIFSVNFLWNVQTFFDFLPYSGRDHCKLCRLLWSMSAFWLRRGGHDSTSMLITTRRQSFSPALYSLLIGKKHMSLMVLVFFPVDTTQRAGSNTRRQKSAFPSFSPLLYSLLGLWWFFGPESICFSVDTTEWARQTWAWLFLSFYHSLSSLVGQNMLLGIPKENVAVHPLPTSHMTWSGRHELDVHFSQFHLNLDFRSLSPELWRGDFWRQTDVQHSFNPFVHFSDHFYQV